VKIAQRLSVEDRLSRHTAGRPPGRILSAAGRPVSCLQRFVAELSGDNFFQRNIG
jgi:hypothetical protein